MVVVKVPSLAPECCSCRHYRRRSCSLGTPTTLTTTAGKVRPHELVCHLVQLTSQFIRKAAHVGWEHGLSDAIA
jgi:hypothetical protein